MQRIGGIVMLQSRSKAMHARRAAHGVEPAGSNGRQFALARVVFAVLIAAFLMASLHVSAIADVRAGAVLGFMNDLAETAIRANKTIDRPELEKLIRNNVDVESIGDYSLGSYISDLSDADTETYYDAVTNFMARYAAMQSRYYQVEKAEFYRPKHHKDGAITLKSRITLAGGSSYRVKWKLVQSHGEYKVLDASIFGFWLTPFQRRLFQSYVREHNDDVQALVSVLAE